MSEDEQPHDDLHIAILYNSESGTVRGEPKDLIALQETENTAWAIYDALSSLGYRANCISVKASLDELRESLSHYSNQNTFIFNICDGFGGKNFGSVQVVKLVESLGFKHTGASSQVIAQCTDKALAKESLIRCNVPTPAYEIFERPEGETNLLFPVIVKPQTEDASLGIDISSVVCSQPELLSRVRYVIEQYEQPALVEEFVTGRELSVSLMGNGKDIQTLPISEDDYGNIENPLHHLLTYEAKWIPESFHFKNISIHCPALLEPTTEKYVYQTAIDAFHALGLRDLGRVDMRYNNLVPYVIDINEIPDLAGDSGFCREARLAGYEYARMIEMILDSGLKREGWR